MRQLQLICKHLHENSLRRLPAIAVRRRQRRSWDQSIQEAAIVCNIVGGVISPILANVFLHYVFDLWINQWRRRHCRGACIVVRYADDFVIGFEHESEARACLESLKERLQKFGLELHPEKREAKGQANKEHACPFFEDNGRKRKPRWPRQCSCSHNLVLRTIGTPASALRRSTRYRRNQPVSKSGVGLDVKIAFGVSAGTVEHKSVGKHFVYRRLGEPDATISECEVTHNRIVLTVKGVQQLA